MAHGTPQGEQVRVFFSSADSTTAAALSLYDSNGVARPLAATERLLLWAIALNTNTTNTLTIFDDINGDGNVGTGEALLVAKATNSSSFCYYGPEGLPGGPGRMPKVKGTIAGQCDVTGLGYVVKG